MSLRVGMIGCGYFGTFQARAWQRITDVDLIGIVELSHDRREALRREFPEVSVFADPNALLQNGSIDVLDIATPPNPHAEILPQFFSKATAIICQKPFCDSLGAAREIVAQANTVGQTLIVHENFRFMPWYRTIERLIREGRLGDIRQAVFRFRPGDGRGKDAYLNRQPYFREMPRFLVHETAIHWIDTFRFLFGEPTSVYADLWRENDMITGEDAGSISFTFSENARIQFDGNRTLDHAAENLRLTLGEFLIEGTKASLVLDGRANIVVRNFGETHCEQIIYPLEDRDFGGDCVFHFQNHVVAHLLHGTELETEANDYLRNLEIESKIYQSASEKRQLTL